MPSAGRLVAGDTNPRLATAAGLAGVKPPVGLTPLTRDLTLFDFPRVTDRWARPLLTLVKLITTFS